MISTPRIHGVVLFGDTRHTTKFINNTSIMWEWYIMFVILVLQEIQVDIINFINKQRSRKISVKNKDDRIKLTILIIKITKTYYNI